MTSTVERTGPAERAASGGPLSPSVAPKLAAAEARLSEFETQRAAVTLDYTLEVPGAADRFNAFQRDVQAAQAAVDRLRVAQREADRRDAIARAESRTTLSRAQLKAMQAHARARDEAAVELSVALETATKANRKFVECTAKMAAALPIGCIFPNGVTPHTFNIMINGRPYTTGFEVLVATEMFRLANGEASIALPGASAPPACQQQPNAIGALPEGIRIMDEFVLSGVREQIDANAKAALDRIANGDLASVE